MSPPDPPGKLAGKHTKSPLPLPVEFKSEAEGPNFKGEIVQMAEQGFMAEIAFGSGLPFHVGHRFIATFSLPTTKQEINESVRVMKIYSRPPSKGETANDAKHWIVEWHFVAPQTTTLSSVEMFIRKMERNLL